MRVRIGTSGWSYKHWLGPFYPKGMRAAEMLPWYARHFDTVEINNSFYRLPTSASFEQWRNRTPNCFCFAVKASRYLTHRKKLREPEEPLDTLFKPVSQLGTKLGPILFQLPPRWHVNLERLETFLALLPHDQKCAIEFRDISWHVREVLDLLRRHNVAFCIYDMAGFVSPLELTANFAYVRFHGPGEKYQGKYSARSLKTWADRIRAWQTSVHEAFIYFNNDPEGHAVRNAQQLRELFP